jgi:peptide/nickel transport system substrate-binding protein
VASVRRPTGLPDGRPVFWRVLRNSALLVLGAILVLSGCSRGPRTDASRSTLIIGVRSEPASLNPLLLSGEDSSTIGPLLFSYLLTVDPHGALVSDVATRVPSTANGDISRDGRTIVYHLRHDVRWQDGQPLTAADVVYTYDAIENPKINVPSRSEGYNIVTSVRALDRYTVRVTLRRRDAPILRSFLAPDQNYPILPQHILAKEPDINHGAFNTAPIGSGPYRFDRWVHGDYLRFVSNPLYFRGQPRIAVIETKIEPNFQGIITQLVTREIDAGFIPTANFPPQDRQMPGLAQSISTGGGAALLVFNLQAPAVNDVRVRRAISEAIDFPRVVREATLGGESYTNAGRGFYGWPFDPQIAPPRYDVANARKLLDAAGWRLGADGKRRRNGVPLTLSYVYSTDSPQGANAGLLIQSDLRRVGIALTLRPYQVDLYVAPASDGGPLFGGRFQLALLDVEMPTDPATDWLFDCDQFPPNGFNLSRFCDATANAANAASIATYDNAGRARDSAIVQQRVAAQLPLIPLWEHRTAAVYEPSLRGVDPSPDSFFWNVGTWYLQ